MATLEWAPPIPFTFTTPFGTLQVNQDLGGGKMFKLNAKNCVSRRGIRANTDPIPQGDGEIFHDRYSTGYEMQFAVQLWQATDQIACDEVLCEMRDELYGHIWSLLRPDDDGGRVRWQPSCNGARILDAIRLQSLNDPIEGEEGVQEITFVVDSPFPYAISETETVVSLSGTVTLPNGGNVDFYPVFKVNGSTSSFTITNNGDSKSYVYSGTNIGGGNYGEIDMFRGGIIYLNGSGANLKNGVDVENSDILRIAPGGQSFSISGASADVLTHAAFA